MNRRALSGKEWALASVFILLHFAAAIIRGVPVELVLLGAVLMLIATIIFSRFYKAKNS